VQLDFETLLASLVSEIGCFKTSARYSKLCLYLPRFELDHVDLHPSRRHYLEFKVLSPLSDPSGSSCLHYINTVWHHQIV
jgi:hypothetical protein